MKKNRDIFSHKKESAWQISVDSERLEKSRQKWYMRFSWTHSIVNFVEITVIGQSPTILWVAMNRYETIETKVGQFAGGITDHQSSVNQIPNILSGSFWHSFLVNIGNFCSNVGLTSFTVVSQMPLQVSDHYKAVR